MSGRTCSELDFAFVQPQVERVYSSYLELNLEDVEPCVSGPKRYISSCAFLLKVRVNYSPIFLYFSFSNMPSL